jgi:hypothetical protein
LATYWCAPPEINPAATAELSTQVAEHGNEYTQAHSTQYAEPNVPQQSPDVAEADQRAAAFSTRAVTAGRNKCHQRSSLHIDRGEE